MANPTSDKHHAGAWCEIDSVSKLACHIGVQVIAVVISPKARPLGLSITYPVFLEYCETLQPLPFDLDSVHDYDLAVGISAQQVVYAGVLRSCFMDHTRLSPANPALAI